MGEVSVHDHCDEVERVDYARVLKGTEASADPFQHCAHILSQELLFTQVMSCEYQSDTRLSVLLRANTRVSGETGQCGWSNRSSTSLRM